MKHIVVALVELNIDAHSGEAVAVEHESSDTERQGERGGKSPR